MESEEKNRNWVERTYIKFGEEIFDVLTAPPQLYEQTEKQVELIDKIIKKFHHSQSSAKILDIPCGDGRISNGLMKKGYMGTGIDISPLYIEKARKKKQNEEFEFLVSDMRKIDYKMEYDILINWFGSFGYFEHKTNLEILNKFYSALKENGLLIMDLTNRDNVIQKMNGFFQLEPELVTRKKDKSLYTVYYFNPLKSQIKTVTRIGEKGPEVEYYMYYYSIHELIKMLRKFNFRILKIYGDYSGKNFYINSPRIIAVARKEG